MPNQWWIYSLRACSSCVYFPPEPKTDTTAQLEKKFPQPTRSKCICFSVCDSVRGWVRAKRGIWSKRVFMRMNGNFFSACVEGILWLFTNFYLQRKLSIFLRNYHDCKVVDPYNRFPLDWPHGGIQRIGWLANWSRILIKWLRRGCVHNLDSLKKNSRTKILLKIEQTYKKLNFGKHPMIADILIWT